MVRVSAVRAGALRRWGIVAAVVAILCALPVVVAVWPVHAAAVGPTALRDRILASTRRSYEGYVDSVGQLALPSLPEAHEVAELFGGTTTARVYGFDVARLAPVSAPVAGGEVPIGQSRA